MDDVPLPDRFAQLTAALNAELVERNEDIACALQALVAGTTFFMLGEPGVAKSLLARRLQAYIQGGEFFDHDMDKFTVPEDLFGPRSLSALKEDRYERHIDGTLLTADYAMLDEFFEASSALLKSLLRALNERTYHHGTEIIPLRLTTLFAASNEVPVEPRLLPLYDRLVVRRQVRRIQGDGGFAQMLQLDRDTKPEPILMWADIEVAQRQAARVSMPEPLIDAVVEIRRRLAAVDIRPSDRRFFEAMRVVRAAAWLDGCEVAEGEHLRVFDNIMWNQPEQIEAVRREVDAVLQPLVSAADELLRTVNEVRRQIRTGLDERPRRELALELSDKLTEATKELKLLRRNPGLHQRQVRKLAEVDAAIVATTERILVDLFQEDPSEVQKKRAS